MLEISIAAISASWMVLLRIGTIARGERRFPLANNRNIPPSGPIYMFPMHMRGNCIADTPSSDKDLCFPLLSPLAIVRRGHGSQRNARWRWSGGIISRTVVEERANVRLGIGVRILNSGYLIFRVMINKHGGGSGPSARWSCRAVSTRLNNVITIACLSCRFTYLLDHVPYAQWSAVVRNQQGNGQSTPNGALIGTLVRVNPRRSLKSSILPLIKLAIPPLSFRGTTPIFSCLIQRI